MNQISNHWRKRLAVGTLAVALGGIGASFVLWPQFADAAFPGQNGATESKSQHPELLNNGWDWPKDGDAEGWDWPKGGDGQGTVEVTTDESNGTTAVHVDWSSGDANYEWSGAFVYESGHVTGTMTTNGAMTEGATSETSGTVSGDFFNVTWSADGAQAAYESLKPLTEERASG